MATGKKRQDLERLHMGAKGDEIGASLVATACVPGERFREGDGASWSSGHLVALPAVRQSGTPNRLEFFSLDRLKAHRQAHLELLLRIVEGNACIGIRKRLPELR